MRRPLLVDLFCCDGGAAMGYWRAGFNVLGVDRQWRPRYPFPMMVMDALEVDPRDLNAAAVHASPPCQAYSAATKRWAGAASSHPELIEPTRELLRSTGLPYALENVPGAPLESPEIACGAAFGLIHNGYALRRHRGFESNVRLNLPGCACRECRLPFMDVTGGGPTRKPRTDGGGGRPYKGTADEARAIMGICWTTKAAVNEAIPPAYTEHVGRRLLAAA